MVVSDLEFCQLIKLESNIITGGASTSASTQTYSSQGFGYAQGDAIAYGDTTFSSADTNTNVVNTSTYYSTVSLANANAVAWDSNGSSRSSSTSHSYFYGGV
ncbi:hypothetical protein [Brasilonema sp. UFV-L1]|uniref:hypothetical protein n=1 Tax=Brasilonema sp. UFV-L1 TaxID=2234130 RepID=UPI00145F0A68|nr:hypothetical protein [Brasilonema sp. UFV-L1]NMG05763.1 hypothetical protein [Brasilonema sp. UFV-L1]